jgi:hypothetical protein
MQAIPMIIAAVGTAASISSQNRAEKERRGILNRQLEESEKATDKAVDLTQQEGQRFDQGQRMADMQAAEDKTYEQTQADLQGAGGASISTAADNSNTSDDFLKTKAQRAIDEGTRLTTIAREAAKARAPGQLRMDDSLSMSRLAGNLSNTWGAANNMGRARGAAAGAVEPPGYGALGTLATAVGGAMAKNGYGQTMAGRTSSATPSTGINWGG